MSELKVEGLTPRQFAVLLAVAQNNGLRQADLADRIGIKRSKLHQMVGRLQSKKLLRRQRTQDDARFYAVWLTDEGRRLLRTAAPSAKQANDPLPRRATKKPGGVTAAREEDRPDGMECVGRSSAGETQGAARPAHGQSAMSFG